MSVFVGEKLVRACKWLWLVVVVQSGEEGGGGEKTEARSVSSGERGTRQLREQSGGRSCDGGSREINQTSSRRERSSLAPSLKQSLRTLMPQPDTKNALSVLVLLTGQSQFFIYFFIS